MSDDIPIHDDMDKPVRMAVNVTAARVEHYDDVVNFMALDAAVRYTKKTGRNPTPKQMVQVKREIARLAIISRDLIGAQKVEIVR